MMNFEMIAITLMVVVGCSIIVAVIKYEKSHQNPITKCYRPLAHNDWHKG